MAVQVQSPGTEAAYKHGPPVMMGLTSRYASHNPGKQTPCRSIPLLHLVTMPGLRSIFFSLPLSFIVHAFVIPQDLPDGFYSISFEPSTGSALSEPELLSTIDPKYSVLNRRQEDPGPLASPEPHCGDGTLNRSDFEAAKAQFGEICRQDTQYPTNMAVVVTAGDAIAYMCNFGEMTNRCWTAEYEEISGLLDSVCGVDRVGTVYTDRWKKSYGRDVKDADICL